MLEQGSHCKSCAWLLLQMIWGNILSDLLPVTAFSLAQRQQCCMLGIACLLLQMTLGDILSDLPCVTNFTFAERQQYASAAQTPAQLWHQRPPKPWQATAEER